MEKKLMMWNGHKQIVGMISGENLGQREANNSWVHPKFNFKRQYYAFPFFLQAL